jgi:1,2-diacylglycerol 3-beta-glucosyltransferase
MATRLLAGGLLLVSALIAWLAISVTLAARLLQAAIALSVVYVAWLAWRGWLAMRAALGEAGSPPGDRPFVSILVPARDEASVIGHLVRDLAAQTYRDAGGVARYEVLVIDDGSTDATADAARRAAGAAPQIQVLRRDDGGGPSTKGAVLAMADRQARGEIIGVLDADARVDPDFLDTVVRAWARDPGAAGIQAQRRPWNAGRSWLTGAQADEQLMDLASQCGRWATDGTAELRGNGMFIRRAPLMAVGGWASDALTEDLELSTRLVVAGEHITLAPEAHASEEAVDTLSALWRQRLRWAEGSLRRLMDHGPRLLVSRLPGGRKADFLAFTAEFLLPPLFVTSILASLITIPLPRPADWTVPVSLALVYGTGSFLLAMAGLAADGVRGPALAGRATRGALFLSHWLIVVPAALLRIALWPGRSGFVTTPRVDRTRGR